MTRRRRGFTLIELLIVVAIIALLVAILLPSLSRARDLTRRAICSSNQHHVGLGLAMYASDDAKGHFPASPDWMNASLTWAIYFKDDGSSTTPASRIGYKNNFLGLGLIYEGRYVDNPELLYCPSIDEGSWFSYPKGWSADPDWRYAGYYYRIFGQTQPANGLTQAVVDKLYNLQPDAKEALTADLFVDVFFYRGNPPHLDPYGLSVAFGDGHAEFMELGEKELRRSLMAQTLSTASRDEYVYLYFKALGSGDFTPLDAAGYTAP